MAPRRHADYGGFMSGRRAIEHYGDALLAAVSAVLFTVQIVSERQFAGDRPLSLVVALGFSATLLARRSAPLVPLLAGLVLIELSNIAAPELANSGTFFVAYVFAIYAAGRHTSGRTAQVAFVAVIAGIPLAAIEPGQPFSVSDAMFIAVAFAGPFAAGRAIRHRHAHEQHLEGRTVELELERDVKAREAVTQERVRIARELHDVVAHAISVIVLQARGGRRKLPDGALETRAALDAIEAAGENALTEMRRLLGMLRENDEELALAPQPSLRRIDELVASMTATGLPVDLTVEGEPVELPPGVDMSAYRIVQEALTNALKHAGPARARVILRYSADDLELEILDDGSGNGHGGGSGHGLHGIRERVAVYGGQLESGARPEGGYALRARLPLGSER
jgi:signal transduction histidine kinase